MREDEEEVDAPVPATPGNDELPFVMEEEKLVIANVAVFVSYLMIVIII